MSEITVYPPQTYSKEQIQEWVDQAVAAGGIDLPVALMGTKEWANYVNNDHFVPLTVEGVPPGHVFDYNWVSDKTKRSPLPAAEVTETGQFSFWWDRCNYYELSEEDCRNFIGVAVNHEGLHYQQWQRVAVSALTFAGHKVDPKQLPRTLNDLEAYPGAKDAFMRVWANEAHYQCREVEVYSTQIATGEMSAEILGHERFIGRVKGMKAYMERSEYAPGCLNSEWVPEFKDDLDRAKALLDQHLPAEK